MDELAAATAKNQKSDNPALTRYTDCVSTGVTYFGFEDTFETDLLVVRLKARENAANIPPKKPALLLLAMENWHDIRRWVALFDWHTALSSALTPIALK